jgi:hypothetical protein
MAILISSLSFALSLAVGRVVFDDAADAKSALRGRFPFQHSEKAVAIS